MILNLATKIPITVESAAKFTFYLRNINHSLLLRLQLLSLRSLWNNNTDFSKVLKPTEKTMKQRLHDYEVILALHCYSLFVYLSFFFFFPIEVVIFCIILIEIHAQTSFMRFPTQPWQDCTWESSKCKLQDKWNMYGYRSLESEEKMMRWHWLAWWYYCLHASGLT